MRAYQLVLMRPASTAAAAGPILEPGDLAGIFVFDAEAAQAERLVAADPAVASKKMCVEQHPWMVAELVLPKGFKVPLP